MTMFYEEKMFEGVLYYRSTPQGEWRVKEVVTPPASGKESVEGKLVTEFINLLHALDQGNVTIHTGSAWHEVIYLAYGVLLRAAKAATPDRREEGNDRGCPCKYLDEPCQPMCTCKNGLYSHGCIYCATYGSLEQRKESAKRIVEWIKLGQRPPAPVSDAVEQDRLWDEANTMVHAKLTANQFSVAGVITLLKSEYTIFTQKQKV